MAYSVSNVAHYDFKADDKLFLDTNVWLHVYGVRRPFDSRVSVYSAALDRILRAGIRIHIDILIVSEFINALHQAKRESWRHKKVQELP